VEAEVTVTRNSITKAAQGTPHRFGFLPALYWT
jgi:hypothetical protein